LTKVYIFGNDILAVLFCIQRILVYKQWLEYMSSIYNQLVGPWFNTVAPGMIPGACV